MPVDTPYAGSWAEQMKKERKREKFSGHVTHEEGDKLLRTIQEHPEASYSPENAARVYKELSG